MSLASGLCEALSRLILKPACLPVLSSEDSSATLLVLIYEGSESIHLGASQLCHLQAT